MTVKNTALGAALDRVLPEVLGGGLVLSLLNGVEHPAGQCAHATAHIASFRQSSVSAPPAGAGCYRTPKSLY
ncbi:hypothetical protein [Streptomyces olivaceus]|uniref:hypothetical protein n=1 Tax=Streptomyces olivaceus TaxID=47716 RepID=UPI003657F64A